MRILFMFPARSGSKGVKDKNIRDLGGKPLMHYAIQAVKDSESFKKHNCYLMLNTDSQQYADIGKKIGTHAPFLRPMEYAADTSIITDAIQHTMDFFEKNSESFDLFALVQLTSPFLGSIDVERAISMFEADSSIDSVISVTKTETPPIWCNILDENLNMSSFISEEIRKKNRQDFPTFYRVTGSIRVARWHQFKSNGFDWHKGNSKALVIKRSHSLDIDTEEDFEYAEFLISKRGVKSR